MMRIVYTSILLLLLVGCSDQQTIAEEEVITLEEFQKAQDEAYNLGYVDGLEAGKQEQNKSVYVPSGDLTTFSDGYDWIHSLELDKKDFIRSLPNILISKRESYLNALDVFYNDVGNRHKTIEEALQNIEGS